MSFTTHTIQPTYNKEIARLSFTVEIPHDWAQVPIPAEEINFSEPDKFLPLAVFMAPYGAVLFTAAVRPAFDDGAVSQWVEFICQKQGVNIVERSMVDTRFGKALIAGATQPSDAGEMSLRLVFIEDDGAFLQFGVMAPSQIFPSLENQLMHSLASVLLLFPKGPTRPLVPGESTKPEQQAAADDTPQTFLQFVQSDNLNALSPDHRIVTYFREKGIGLTPRIHGVEEAKGYATLAAAAIESFLSIPLGWHIIDDGKRTLIFDKPSGTQINIVLAEESTIDEIFSNVEADIVPKNPSAEHRRIELEGTPALVFRNLNVDGEVLDQVYIPVPHPTRQGAYLKVRLTTPPASIVPMLNLTGLIAGSLRAQP